MAFWDVKYEANVEPDSDGWTLYDEDLSSASGGVLTMDTNLGDSCLYKKSETIDFTTGFTFQFRAKVVSTEGNFPFVVQVGTSVDDVRLYLKEDSIYNHTTKLIDFDTTDTFHTYRVSILNTTLTLYIDGVDKGDFDTLGNPGNLQVAFGDQSAQSAVKIYIDYLYYAGSVTYDIPIVDTDAATGIKNVYCTGNGDITDDGGDFITEYGFEYGETSGVGNFCVRRTGASLGVGEFSLTVDGLKPETTYYYRAYATNANGDGYGSWVSFTTGASPSHGIYEESNAATICFYVRRAGGKWSIKHGPYTEDQADIEIGKILTEGKGKYQIKFTSDVLTGLSVNIMTKLDIKAR